MSTEDDQLFLFAPPKPLPKPVGDGLEGTIVGYYADGLKAKTGLPLPRTTATHLAKVVVALRVDGVDDASIMRGIDVLLAKGLTPGALPGAVIEAALDRPPPKGEFVCPICALAFKTATRLTEHLSDVHHVDASTAADPSQPI
jgi:hypothetical protein